MPRSWSETEEIKRVEFFGHEPTGLYLAPVEKAPAAVGNERREADYDRNSAIGNVTGHQRRHPASTQ
jgi:hypothetical protein